MITIWTDGIGGRELALMMRELVALNGGTREGITRAPNGSGVRVSDEIGWRYLDRRFGRPATPVEKAAAPAVPAKTEQKPATEPKAPTDNKPKPAKKAVAKKTAAKKAEDKKPEPVTAKKLPVADNSTEMAEVQLPDDKKTEN